MQIFVKPINCQNYKTFVLDISNNCNIKTLREIINSKIISDFKLNKCECGLYFSGHILCDDNDVIDYKISENNTIGFKIIDVK